MNTNTNTTPIMNNIDNIEKPTRKRAPTLSAKYSKFIQFSYYLIQQFRLSSEIDLDESTLTKVACIFGDITEQERFVEGFLSNTKTIVQDMKQQKKLDAKAAKDYSKQIDKQLKASEKAKSMGTKDKKPRKTPVSKKKTESTENELITELVQLANNIPVVETPVVETPVVEPPVVETPVVKTPVVEETVVEELTTDVYIADNTITTTVNEPITKTGAEPKTKPKKPTTTKTVKESKPKTVKEPKTKVEVTPIIDNVQVVDTDDEAESELEVEPKTINGIEYYIDAQNNIYDANTQNFIGVYNEVTNSIII